MWRQWITLFAVYCTALTGFAQLVVTPTSDPAASLQQLLGGGVTLSNVVIDCDVLPDNDGIVAFGEFDGSNANLGLGKGIILSTGNAIAASGQNDSTNDADTDLGLLKGYQPLSAICGQKTVDVCRVSFDVVPQCDTLSIRYVFASDEYMEFVNDIKNDAFGFFVSGPGITGVQNIALVPKTNLPVSIKNINCMGSNSQYYLCNEPTNTAGAIACPSPTKCPSSPAYTSHSFDGFTVPLVAKIAVHPCLPYHVELAIADASDGKLDSGVFLEAGGIACSAPMLTFANETPKHDAAIEGCKGALVHLNIPTPMPQPYTYHFSIGGSATMGKDYLAFPDSITFPAGVTDQYIPINAIFDTLAEGIEYVELTYTIVQPCTHKTLTSTIQIDIRDSRQVFCQVPAAVCAGESAIISLCTESDCSYEWSNMPYISRLSDSQAVVRAPMVNAPMRLDFVISINTNDGECQFTDTARWVVYPLPTVHMSTDSVCLGSPNTLRGSSPDSIQTWIWTFANGNTKTGQTVQEIFAAEGLQYVLLSVTDDHECTATAAGNALVYPRPKADFSISANNCVKAQVECINTSQGGISQRWHMLGSAPVYQPVWHYIFSQQGIYPLMLRVANQFGCFDSITKSLDIHPQPNAEIAAASLCALDSGILISISTTPTNIFPQDNIVAYQWQSKLPISGTPPDNTKPTYRLLCDSKTGAYLVKLTVTNNAGCTDDTERLIPVNPAPPAPMLSGDTVCFGKQALLKASISPPATYVEWASAPQGGNIVYKGIDFVTPPMIIAQPFFARAVTDVGCHSEWRSTLADVFPQAQGELLPQDTILNDGQGTVKFRWKGNLLPATYSWRFDNGGTSSDPTPSHYFAVRGIYPVALALTDEHGCEVFYETTVTVRLPSNVYVPSAFSPNGDGYNDIFFINAYLVSDMHFSIFNRVGETIFSTKDIDFQWDGTAYGKPALEGTYMYVLDATDVRGNNFYLCGTITLFR